VCLFQGVCLCVCVSMFDICPLSQFWWVSLYRIGVLPGGELQTAWNESNYSRLSGKNNESVVLMKDSGIPIRLILEPYLLIVTDTT